MKNLSIFEPQIKKHYAYKETCSLNIEKASRVWTNLKGGPLTKEYSYLRVLILLVGGLPPISMFHLSYRDTTLRNHVTWWIGLSELK